MKKLLTLMFGVFLLAVLGAPACAFLKPAASTVNDAAKVACEAMFGAEAEAQGLSLEEICATREVLDPIVRQLLAAKNEAAQGVPALRDHDGTGGAAQAE